jgi:hypothetical protein
MTLFLPFNQAISWRRTFKKYKIGAWIDLNQWFKTDENGKPQKPIILDLPNIHSVLVMTVQAGKSGQKLTPDVEKALSKFVEKNSEMSYFVIDGGWNKGKAQEFIDKNNPQSNVDFVSYSGFWGNI